MMVYGNTILSSFHFDDIPSILEKPWIRGWDKISQFIFSITQRPLVILSFNINYSISDFEVWSYHIFNIGFHIIATLLVYNLVFQISFFLKDISNQNKQYVFWVQFLRIRWGKTTLTIPKITPKRYTPKNVFSPCHVNAFTDFVNERKRVYVFVYVYDIQEVRGSEKRHLLYCDLF